MPQPSAAKIGKAENNSKETKAMVAWHMGYPLYPRVSARRTIRVFVMNRLRTHCEVRAWEAAGAQRKRFVLMSSIGVARRAQMPFPIKHAVAYAKAVSPPAQQARATPAVTEVDGVQLHLKSSNATGYAGVSRNDDRFVANCSGKYLGIFATAIEAAVAYAKASGKSAKAAGSCFPG